MSIRVVVPQIGQSIAEAVIVKWYKKPGDPIEKGETLVEIGTDKINTEIPAPVSGIVEKLLVEEGTTVEVNTEIAVLSDMRGAGKATEIVRLEAQGFHSEAPLTPQRASVETSDVRHSPFVRKLAQEHNIDLSHVRGTGDAGRITKDDVLQFIEQQKTQEIQETSDVERIPMTRIRKLIAEHMVLSKRTAADLTTFFEIDMSAVVREREIAKEIFENQYALKLTYLPFVVAAVSRALRKFPVVNSSIEGDFILYRKECNIGIAMAVEDGLLVPVIRRADEKSVLDLTRAVADLAERARARHLSADDLQGGTFSITNPGVFGALMGTPIIHQPQVAILGIGAVVKRAVVIQDAITIRPMACFSLTYDHRAMDGAVADQFLAHIKKTLENECPPALK